MFKRKIFYLSGFDPRGARFYHEVFVTEAAKFNAMAGRSVAIGPRRKLAPHSSRWDITDQNPAAQTDYVCLGWDDIVRDNWVRNPISLLARTLQAYWNFTRLVDWPIVKRFPLGVRVAFYYPAFLGILMPILLGLAAGAIGWALFGKLWAIGLGALALLGFGGFVMTRLKGFWLLRFIIFNDLLARDRLSSAMTERIEQFATMISDSLNEDWDEILFVSHSNGSIVAIPALARLLDLHGGSLPDRFSFVSLGSCIPLVGNRKDSHHFHDQLERVGQGDFRWLDLGSITDIICIPTIDPCISCRKPRRAELIQLSPRWHRYSFPERYAARRADRHQCHFDYLRTFDFLSPLDYIAISSGARPLKESIVEFRAEASIPPPTDQAPS